MGITDRIIRDIALKYNLEIDEVENVVRSQTNAAKHVMENKGTIHIRYIGKFFYDERIANHLNANKQKKKDRNE